MINSRPLVVLGTLAALHMIGPRPVNAEPVMVTAKQAAGSLRTDAGNGICATVVHVKDPAQGAPFNDVNDAITQINQQVGQGNVDGKISRVFKTASFRNADAAAKGDFYSDPNTGYFPFSDSPMADPRGNDRNFAARVRGYINVNPAGLYSNAVQAYSGERLSIGGNVLTQYDERVAARVVRQVKYAATGLYPVELIYYANGSVAILELSATMSAEPEGRQLSLDTTKFHLIPTAQLYTARAGSTTTCTECTADGECGAAGYCAKDFSGPGPDGLCAPCLVDDHCGPSCTKCAGTTPICSTGTCVQCLQDSQCSPGYTCDTTSKTCQGGTPCALDTDCPTGKICDPSLRICTTPPPPCVDDTNCSPTQQCDLVRKVCVDRPTACTTDGQCRTGQRCDTVRGYCVNAQMPHYIGGCTIGTPGGRPGGAGGSTPLWPMTLLCLPLLLGFRRRALSFLRRTPGRRLLPLSLIVLGFFFSTEGRAQQPLSANSQTFRPAIGPEDLITLEGSRTPGRLRPMFVGLLEFDYRPIRLYDPVTNSTLADTVRTSTVLHLMGGLGLTRWLSAAVDLPIVLYQEFDRRTPYTDVPKGQEPFPFGVGDLRLVVKFRILNNEKGGLGLAFVPQLTFPTGSASNLRSEGAVDIEPRVALDWRTRGGSFIVLNLSFLARTSDQIVGDELVTHQVRYGLGGLLALPMNFAVLGEIAGGTSISSVQNGTTYTPLEGHVAGRWVHKSGINANLGIGTGFTNAVGSPQFRFFASLGYLPFGEKEHKLKQVLHRLDIDKMGSGTGAVHSEPGGIMCGQLCWAEYPPGTEVVLKAEPAQGSHFVGWSGPCSGTDPCVVTVREATRVGVMFARNEEPRAPLTVEKMGEGTGVVTSEPSGINCGKACTQSYKVGQEVVLTARPEPGMWFGGWEGPCTGTGPCTVAVGAATTVRAKFNESKVEVKATKIDLKGNVVHFETAKATIDTDSHVLLDEIVGILVQNPTMRLRIEGHSDDRRFRAAGGNLKLSKDRAKAVLDYLVAHGIATSRLSSEGYGELCPIASNKTDEGRAKNRRTEFWIDTSTAPSKQCRAKSEPKEEAPADKAKQ